MKPRHIFAACDRVGFIAGWDTNPSNALAYLQHITPPKPSATCGCRRRGTFLPIGSGGETPVIETVVIQ